jgi:hypothetical protein
MLPKFKVGDRFKIVDLEAQGFVDMVAELNAISYNSLFIDQNGNLNDDERFCTGKYLGLIGTVTKVEKPYRTEEWVQYTVEFPKSDGTKEIIKLLGIFMRGAGNDQDTVKFERV